ncbi:MAG: hypothetical protein LQ340_006518 [Diploschistes diacapsis]|nr:MAG: hypothetical protein LQ340_006518 [Diploschistes diacapsis]
MKFSTTITAALFAATTLAAPTAESRLAKRIARRASSRRTNPVQWITSNAETDGGNEPGKTDAEESTNWSGVVIQSPPSGTKFTAVSATFTVPKPTSTGGSSEQAASAWVGIDGDTCGSAILQTGVDFNVQGSSVSYDSWYEWYPDYAYDFSGISFSVGDQVALSVVASSTTSGTATIKNLSTGQTVSKQITSSSALCQENAEWIVEDFEEGGGLVPFADFNQVTFSNAVAHTSNGGTVDAGTGTQIDIVQNGRQLTQVSDSGTTVTVKYT